MIELSATRTGTKLPNRDTLDAHDDDHKDAHDEEHQDGHEDGHEDEHDHAHGADDPHLWLDPANAQNWLTLIADTLSQQDPVNKEIYQSNAKQMQTRLEALTQNTAKILMDVPKRYMAGHDSYQYFEHRFGLTLAGAISLGDASKPGPARLSAIRDEVLTSGATCLAVDINTSPDLIATVTEGTGLTATVIDPTGAKLTPGPDLYTDLIRNMGEAFTTCLGRTS